MTCFGCGAVLDKGTCSYCGRLCPPACDGCEHPAEMVDSSLLHPSGMPISRCRKCFNFWLYNSVENRFSNPAHPPVVEASAMREWDPKFTWPTWPDYQALPRGGYF